MNYDASGSNKSYYPCDIWFVIGLVGGMVGLVLGVVRFPVVLSAETSASVTAGTNLGVSTLGAISAALRHYRLGNIHYRLFLILGLTGAAGAFIGSFLTATIPYSYHYYSLYDFIQWNQSKPFNIYLIRL